MRGLVPFRSRIDGIGRFLRGTGVALRVARIGCETLLIDCQSQPMKTNTNAAWKIVTFQMARCAQRSICSRLGCLILTVPLLVLPLRGIEYKPAPLLTPLVTELVPLGTSLESPPASSLHLLSFLASARLVLGPVPSAAFGLKAEGNGQLCSVTGRGFLDPRSVDTPHGRSPPLDSVRSHKR
jgi:hypothetical protein